MAEVLTSKPTAGRESRNDIRTLLLAQKTELMGELTRAIANQFNNTMMAITGYAELEMKKAPASQKKSLEQVLTSAGRATALVQQLLSMTGKQPAPQTLDLNAALIKIENFIEQLVGEKVSVQYKLDPGAQSIHMDATEVEQVVLSLAINARNAMVKGGTLTIATKIEEVSREMLGEDESANPGTYMMLSVDDTGYGRTFEELKSADSSHHDSRVGLSLAAVHGIVKNAEGWVRFSSEPGKGSSFKVYFPVSKSGGSVAKARTAPRNLPMTRTVLVVEDDDAVRVPASEFLMMEGFKVLQARTGSEALRVVEQNRSTLDVLITDIVMPKMSGHEVAEKLTELNPSLKVLFMSGDTGEAGLSKIAASSKDSILCKPFRLETLKDRIHDLLGE